MNIALCNPIIDLVQLSEAIKSGDTNKDGQQTTGRKSQKQFVGYGQAKALNLIVFHLPGNVAIENVVNKKVEGRNPPRLLPA